MNVNDKVEKVGGDYSFIGVVVAKFNKLSGKERFVVEDDRGILHIFSEKNLRPFGEKNPETVFRKPVSLNFVTCYKCGHHVVVAQYESTDTPRGHCAFCGTENQGYYNTVAGQVENKRKYIDDKPKN